MRHKCTLAFFIILMLLLTACSKKQVPSESESLTLTESREEEKPKKGVIDTPAENRDAADAVSEESVSQPLVREGKEWKELREKAQENGCICSVAFLGTSLDLEEGMAGFLASEEAEQYLDAYPFIKEIPDEGRITHPDGGYEVYCIVPTDPEASVAVNTWEINEDNDFCGESGQVLYRSDCGDPILLLGNLSDIMPSLDVEIVDREGRVLSYQPFLSLYDGSLSVLPEIYDFTMYHDPDFIGRWYASIPAELGGGIALDLNIQRGGNLTYSYGRGNGVPIAVYEGTWSVSEDQSGMKCLVFELTLVEGIEDNDLWGQYGSGELYEQICGAWTWERGDGPGAAVLRLTHIEGDPFISGYIGTTVFEREDP